MKVTESSDGVARATVRIDFRINHDALGLAVLECMNDDLAYDYEDPGRVERYVGQLTRKEVEETLRSRLQAAGYERLDFGGERLEPGLVKALEETATETARHLFPEFDR